MADVWEQWRPPFASHVVGSYTKRELDPETGQHESQKWKARCERCGQSYEGWCDSGQVRRHIARFATQHLHADPLAAPRVRRPGSAA